MADELPPVPNRGELYRRVSTIPSPEARLRVALKLGLVHPETTEMESAKPQKKPKEPSNLLQEVISDLQNAVNNHPLRYIEPTTEDLELPDSLAALNLPGVFYAALTEYYREQLIGRLNKKQESIPHHLAIIKDIALSSLIQSTHESRLNNLKQRTENRLRTITEASNVVEIIVDYEVTRCKRQILSKDKDIEKIQKREDDILESIDDFYQVAKKAAGLIGKGAGVILTTALRVSGTAVWYIALSSGKAINRIVEKIGETTKK